MTTSALNRTEYDPQYYNKLLGRKRPWTPLKPTPNPEGIKSEAIDSLGRALSLRVLELPVGDFIVEASRKEIPEGSMPLLLSNIQDEVKHDEALNLLAESTTSYLPTYDKEAAHICKTWVELDAHPILKAMTLERGVFFVLLPFLRFQGNTAMRSISQDISRDEQTHVACNSMFVKQMGIDLTAKVDKLRRATIVWIFQNLVMDESDAYLNKDFWLRQSDRLMYEGRAPELEQTQMARDIAFFETPNQHIPTYQ